MASLVLEGRLERTHQYIDVDNQDCEEDQDLDSSSLMRHPAGGTTEAALANDVVRQLRKCAAWVSLLTVGLLVVCHLMGIRRSSGFEAFGFQMAVVRAGSSSIFLNENISRRMDGDNCEAYFRGFQDCSKENLWNCRHDDGSWGYVCCCYHGFGNFSQTKQETTGMISWSKNPELCLDVSTPYSLGHEFTSGPFIAQLCKWGDPNKHYHLPRQGKGQIRWASHPNLCVGVQDGMNAGGELLKLMECKDTPLAWTNWYVDPGRKIITWVAHPDKCIRISDNSDGALAEIRHCDNQDDSQKFDIVEPTPMPTKEEYPRLFCISLMLPFGAEVKLMRAQFIRQIGIFECWDYAIYSNISITFRSGSRSIVSDIMPGDMSVKFGGKWHSALNTDIFIRFWGVIVKDPRAWRNHWSIKLDPDAVFFASRFQQLTRSIWPNGDSKYPVFLNNCHLGMHGPIEAIARHALGVYEKRWKECIEGEPYTHKQEDFYMRRCWRMLGIKQMDVYNLLEENNFACDERASTRDGRHPCFSKQVSFHPFKRPEDYWECYRRGKTQHWSTPLVPIDEIPGHKNFHHG